MSKQTYIEKRFNSDSAALIAEIDGIIKDYVAQGYRLTVRQLYYQLVARAIVENTERSYKRITGLVNDAKLAGLLDWDAIEDRTREFIRVQRWDSAKDILDAAARGFHMDMWENQKVRVYCVVEKEALAGVLERACRDLDIPLLAARGYPSGTVLREFCLSDLIPCFRGKQRPVILHLGDHDPSGIDMSRDLAERFCLFTTGRSDSMFDEQYFNRIALNMNQIEEEEPPPNPAKTTDARFAGYSAKFGDESWELDALRPEYLDQLVRRHAEEFIDRKKWKARKAEIEQIKARIHEIADDFEE